MIISKVGFHSKFKSKQVKLIKKSAKPTTAWVLDTNKLVSDKSFANGESKSSDESKSEEPTIKSKNKNTSPSTPRALKRLLEDGKSLESAITPQKRERKSTSPFWMAAQVHMMSASPARLPAPPASKAKKTGTKKKLTIPKVPKKTDTSKKTSPKKRKREEAEVDENPRKRTKLTSEVEEWSRQVCELLNRYLLTQQKLALTKAVKELNTKNLSRWDWPEIAKHVAGKNAMQCQEKYFEKHHQGKNRFRNSI